VTLKYFFTGKEHSTLNYELVTKINISDESDISRIIKKGNDEW
jgi:hypothetical protein